jgi:quinol monooxygenase YgiN
VSRIVIFTRLTAAPGKRAALRDVLDQLAVSTRAEPGNEMFGIHEARDEPDVMLGYEVFRDDEALAAHRATEAVAQARERLDDLLAEPPVITYALD